MAGDDLVSDLQDVFNGGGGCAVHQRLDQEPGAADCGPVVFFEEVKPDLYRWPKPRGISSSSRIVGPWRMDAMVVLPENHAGDPEALQLLDDGLRRHLACIWSREAICHIKETEGC
jgi:hypothetical protein